MQIPTKEFFVEGSGGEVLFCHFNSEKNWGKILPNSGRAAILI